jgi:hypothetical protein
MALFSFADIKFKSDKRTGFESSVVLESKYPYDIYRYPRDLGSIDKGHYMVFHINQQRRSDFKYATVPGDKPTVIQNRETFGTPTGGTGIPFTDQEFQVQFTRTISRTTDTVALYMPDTVNFVHNQGYSEPSLTGPLAAALAVGSEASSIVDSIKSLSGANADEVLKQLTISGGNLSPFIATAVKDSPLLSAGFTAFAGVVVNPMLEMIYSSPEFRSFRFDFMFYPRDEKEAEEVQRIIQRLHFHQAPEILREARGFFLVPPSEFDIMFYYNGKVNPNIPKISTCVLQSIDIDYAPNGFSAYEVQGETTPKAGRTGMPVAIRMSLQFKETEIMTKDNFNSLQFTNYSTSQEQEFTRASQAGEYGTS